MIKIEGLKSYNIKLNCDRNLIEQLIQSYITANDFKLIEKNGEKYYRTGDRFMSGYKYFNYAIIGDELKIYAWFKGLFGKLTLDDKLLKTNIIAIRYRESIGILFQEIEKINK